MAAPSVQSTRTLDHVVMLFPPGPDSIKEAKQQFEDQGFVVTPGGTHADGLTANALVILSDSTYLELLAFVHPVSHYPPSSAEREKREKHFWASKSPGVIDFAHLAVKPEEDGLEITEIINARAAANGSGIQFLPAQPGGRPLEDGSGRVLKWAISAVDVKNSKGNVHRGDVPFFCQDLTERGWRAPTGPQFTRHPNGALNIYDLRILVHPENFSALAQQVTTVVGSAAIQEHDIARWLLETPSGNSSAVLELSPPRNAEEEEILRKRGQGVFEVGIEVGVGARAVVKSDVEGRIVIHKS